jgi:phospholipid-binding lipoprotein MlaA
MMLNKPFVALVLLVALTVSGLGCAKKGAAPVPPPAYADDEAPAPQIDDPLEGWNRFWFGFNDVLFTYVGKPFVRVYTVVAPKYLRDRIDSAYQNYMFPARFVNALLQLRPDKASRELGRFMINTTFGLGGLYDLAAAKPDMQPQQLDFGQTMGLWGAGHGFYLVLPFFGPSSLRDGLGLAGDLAAQPLTYVDIPLVLSFSVAAGARMNRLPEMLDIYDELKRSAVEPYSSARDAFVQMRAKAVRDAQTGAMVQPPR